MKKKKSVWLASIFLALAVSGHAFGATFYVDDDAGGPGTGTRTSPFPTIQAGIDRAAYGDTVRVASGTYHERIVLKNGVRLIAGSGPPTIDGDQGGSVVTAIDLGSATRFDGFRVVNGDASEGGGMYVDGSSLDIRYCTFENNNGWSGGGLFLVGASPRITDCRFVNNRSVNGGGIEMQFNSNPVVDGCDFQSNTANHDIGVAFGGGIRMGVNCNPTIKDCHFSDNYADPYGGGMAIFESAPIIENCVFDGNRTSHWGFGGGIWAEELETQAWIFNSTFSHNQALVGGAVYSKDGALSLLINCTLYGNRATGSASAKGGALFSGSGSTIGAFNSIIWNNSTPQIDGYAGSTTVIQYCDVQGGYAGAGNLDTDPGFVNADGGNFHLRSDSACIDTGQNLWVLPASDADGDERVIDGDGDGTAVADMGVDEYNSSRPLLFSISLPAWF